MNAYEFERLVRDLFAKLGYDTWRTESSRDDGIDAVATKSDPYMPVECIRRKSVGGGPAQPDVDSGLVRCAPGSAHSVQNGYPAPRQRLVPPARARRCQVGDAIDWRARQPSSDPFCGVAGDRDATVLHPVGGMIEVGRGDRYRGGTCGGFL